MNIILYTTHCPKCRVLEKKLNSKGIKYATVSDIDIMLGRNIKTVPVLQINENLYNFGEAVEWINSLEEKN